MNTREELSLRQVLAAVALSGLSLAAAQAGELDWRWGLVGVAVSVPPFAWVIMRLRSGPIYKGVYGVALTAVYTGWSALTLGHVLGQAAHRLELTGGRPSASISPAIPSSTAPTPVSNWCWCWPISSCCSPAATPWA